MAGAEIAWTASFFPRTDRSVSLLFGFRVLCLDCGEQTSRGVLQERFESLNPTWSAEARGVAPDGDVFLTEEQVQSFRVPSCARCGGPLKPDVVFFGDTVNPVKVDFVHRRVREADSLLVVGSSLQVSDLVRVVTALRGSQFGFWLPASRDLFLPVSPRTGILWLQVYPHCTGEEATNCNTEYWAHAVG